MTTTKRNVIWVASYPKSGNSWITSVLSSAGVRYGFPAKNDVYQMAQKGDIPPICPCVSERFCSNPCSVLKTHSAYDSKGQPHRFAGLDLETVGFVHIYRNPLDVLLSYINFTRIEYKYRPDSAAYQESVFGVLLGFDAPIPAADWEKCDLDAIPQSNLDHALDVFSANNLTIPNLAPMSRGWPEHTQSWLSASADIPGYSIRYEDCLRDSEQFSQLASFFTFGKQEITAAVEQANRRARDQAAHGDWYHSVFYSKRTAYYFQRYFSAPAIRRFCGAHEALLLRYGYGDVLSVA